MSRFGDSWRRGATRVPMSTMLLAWLLVATGCSMGTYRASSLPPELQAVPTANARTVDLSRFAIPATSSERIDRGDVLEVSISAGLGAEETVTFPVRVNDRGIANLPIIGSLELAGLELEGAEAAIAAACIHRGLYRSPHVTVTMKRQRINRVMVVGAVKEEGVYELPRGASDLLAAIVAAGGLADDAGTVVEIRDPRRGRRHRTDGESGTRDAIAMTGHSTEPLETAEESTPGVIRVDLASATSRGESHYVDDGSVVIVERRDPQPLQVLGLVRKPGRYDYPVGHNLHVLDAIALAEGVSSPVADKIFVIRQKPGQPNPAVIQVSLKRAKRQAGENILLMAGDIVSVEQTPATILMDAIRLINFGIGASLGTIF